MMTAQVPSATVTDVDVGALRLRVTRTEGSGPAVLLIGGLGHAAAVWEPLVGRLTGIPTIAVDAPGMGGSSTPLRPLLMGELATVYADLVRALGGGPVDVLGFSFGGAVAQQLAHQSPSTVRRLVLCATGPGLGGVPGRPVALQELASPWRFYSAKRLERVSPLLYGGERARHPERYAEDRRARLASPPSVYGYCSQLTALMGWSSLPWLDSLSAPALVVAGGEDPVFPVENALLLGRRLRQARVEVIDRAGHLLIVDDADQLAGLLQQFLRDDHP
jgi:poly(3-hydroxyoctanoate) depolymerase